MSGFDKYERSAELEAYCNLVDKYASLRLNEDISNGKPEHAVYLIAKLFDLAKEKVRLYSDHLEHKVQKIDGTSVDLYGDENVLRHVARFLRDPGRRLEVVIENDVDNIQSHPLFLRLDELDKDRNILGRCEIRKIISPAKDWLLDNEFTNHFMISDDSASRVEINDDPKSYAAQANFGDSEKGKKLSNLFDNMHWKYAEPIKSWGL